MTDESDLEAFYRCLGCYGRLISHWFKGENGDVPYVVCHNSACTDIHRVFPEGYGVRLMKANSQLFPQADVYNTYPIGPLITDKRTTDFQVQYTAFSGQIIQAKPFLNSGMLDMNPAPKNSFEAVNAGDERRIREVRQETIASVSKQGSSSKFRSTAKLEKPLSELTNYAPEPLRSIESYVNRPTEERLMEARAQGKTPRPLNAFILYRKAYNAHSKQFRKQNDIATISHVLSDSWRLETQEVRRRFFESAKTDSANHYLAHPDYKYTRNRKPKN
ncbi:hypothetical protein VPNG_03100 [Cytospora leucostoma]|uniref:HMG box domain-containing protein n=1 Tax=Cytospora leucostoma TaxID=1230097 RepID=A0A423XG81_9PEZI|nr:hypothetical protein VPNG_03100 [Cytospora leucostoma]